jgi:hypothetical protein
VSLSIVQQVFNSKGSSGTSLVLTISAPAAGHSLIVLAGCSGSVRISSISGGGVTWARASGLGSQFCDCWIGPNSSGSGTTVTITLSTTGVFGGYVLEIPTSAPGVDAAFSQPNTTTTTTTPTTGTIHPVDGYNALVLALMAAVSTGPTAGPTNGFTALTAGGAQKGAYKLETATTGTYSTSWTTASEASGTLIVVITDLAKDLADGDTFTTAGKYARKIPAGISMILMHLRSGGGASGASISTCGGGGGGGGESFLDGGTPVTVGDLFVFTVGAGGVGGAGAGGNATKTSVTQNGTAVGPGAAGCFAGQGGKVGSLSVAADGGAGGTFSGSPSGLGSTTGDATSGNPAAGAASEGTGVAAGGGDGGGGCPIAHIGGNGGNTGAASPELGHATPGTGAGAGGASGSLLDGLGTSCGYGGDAPTSAANGNNGQDGGVKIVFVNNMPLVFDVTRSAVHRAANY